MDMEFQALPLWSNSLCWLKTSQPCEWPPATSRSHPSYSSQCCRDTTTGRAPKQHPSAPHSVGIHPSAHPGDPGHPPAQQPQLARPVLVHDNSQGQRDGTEQEGPDGEGQVQHFILGVAGRPFVPRICAIPVFRAVVGVLCAGERGTCVRMGFVARREEKSPTQRVPQHAGRAASTFHFLLESVRNGEGEQQEDRGNLRSSSLSRKRMCRHPGDRHPLQQQGKNLTMEVR